MLQKMFEIIITININIIYSNNSTFNHIIVDCRIYYRCPSTTTNGFNNRPFKGVVLYIIINIKCTSSR